MVQEVQQQGNRYQTPNEIQGIGEIRRRVREHTQVTPSFSYECTANGSVTIYFSAYQTIEKEGNLSISSSDGNTEFRVVNGGLYIPLAGAYLAEISVKGGTSAAYFIHKLKIGKTVLVSQKSTSSTPTVVSKMLNLGRGNILNYYGEIHNTTEGGNTFTCNITITLKKL